MKLNVSLERRDASFKFDAKLDIGSWQAGPVEFGDTTFKVLLDPSTSTFRIGVKTSAKFGDGLFSLDANFESSGTGAARTVSLQGSAALRFRLAGASFQRRDDVLVPHRSVGYDEPRSAATSTLDLKVFSASVDIRKLEYDSRKGGLQDLDVSAPGDSGIDSSARGRVESRTAGCTTAAPRTRLRLDFNVKIRLWRILTRDFQLKIELETDPACHSESESPAGELTIPVLVAPGYLQLRGAIAGALTWSPNAGFGVRIDEAFSSTICLRQDSWCVQLAGAEVNRNTGVVTVRVVGIPFPIQPERYGA